MRTTAAIASMTISAVAFLAGLAAVVALAVPQTRISPLSGLAQAHEARANTLVSAPNPTPQALQQARIETLASVREAPGHATAWLRLAYLDSIDGDGLGPEGNLALARSWAVAPLGPDDTPWRLRFAFNHWSALDPANRRLALDELNWSMIGGYFRSRSNLDALQDEVADPSGQLALSLTTRLRSAPPRRDDRQRAQP